MAANSLDLHHAHIMLMHVIAHEGCMDTVRESAPKVDSRRKIPRRTGESNLRHRRADPTLYQLSYIPETKCMKVYSIT